MELAGLIIGFTAVVICGIAYYNWLEYKYYKANGGKLTFKEFFKQNNNL